MQGWVHLDVVVNQGVTTIQLLSSEDIIRCWSGGIPCACSILALTSSNLSLVRISSASTVPVRNLTQIAMSNYPQQSQCGSAVWCAHAYPMHVLLVLCIFKDKQVAIKGSRSCTSSKKKNKQTENMWSTESWKGKSVGKKGYNRKGYVSTQDVESVVWNSFRECLKESEQPLGKIVLEPVYHGCPIGRGW